MNKHHEIWLFVLLIVGVVSFLIGGNLANPEVQVISYPRDTYIRTVTTEYVVIPLEPKYIRNLTVEKASNISLGEARWWMLEVRGYHRYWMARAETKEEIEQHQFWIDIYSQYIDVLFEKQVSDAARAKLVGE